MTFNEFRAWIEGFNHSINLCPNPQQWNIILKKLELVKENENITLNPYINGSCIPLTNPLNGKSYNVVGSNSIPPTLC